METLLNKQKLLTVYLDNFAYAKGKVLVGSFGDKHGFVEEHLASYLEDGWRVATVHGFGGTSGAISGCGWITVLLEKSA